MVFVGGDQMTSEMTVPLSRATPVMPGEEVNVAVEMIAPSELGRYLGYWRLAGPRGRKFGQRVWCHVQVVDPSAENSAPADDETLSRAMAEIEKKKSDAELQVARREEEEERPLVGVHPGVECDRSGMCPIVGVRYNLRGRNFDLCQAE